jgi:hypothetical protein
VKNRYGSMKAAKIGGAGHGAFSARARQYAATGSRSGPMVVTSLKATL